MNNPNPQTPMTFKEKIETNRIDPKALARAAKIKLSTIKVYMSTNRPSHKALAALEAFLPQGKDQGEEDENLDTSSSPLVGRIVALPPNGRLRLVDVPGKGTVKAWCKIDRYNRRGLTVRLREEGGKYYVKEQV